MNADEFLRFAGVLVARYSNDEAALRTAISRAYYGAYHVGVELLGRACTEHLDHGSVRRLLKESGIPSAQRAGLHLDDLQGSRVKADYRLEVPVTLRFAMINVEREHEVRSLIASLESA